MEFDRLEELLTAMSEGTLTEEERAELNAALLADTQLRSQAAGWLCEESLLRQEAAVLAGSCSDAFDAMLRQDEAKGPRQQARPTFPTTTYYIAASIGGAVLACSLVLNVLQRQSSVATSNSVAESGSIAHGARLTKVTGCIWDSPADSAPVRGGLLSGGETLKLLQGIAEIDIQDKDLRATIRLLGPCTAAMQAAGLPELRSGRMVATFHVFGTPASVETPLGTLELSEDASLGIVRNSDNGAVHLLEGVARWKSAPGAGSAGADVPRGIIQQGEAITCQFAGSQPVRLDRSAADIGVFAEEQSMATDRLDIGPRYAEIILSAKPAGYWRFARTPNGVLENEVAGGVALKMGGEVSTVSYGANSALEFGMTRRAGYLYSEDLWPAAPIDEFTAEVWVKPSHFHNGSILALTTAPQSPDGFTNHAMLLELGGAQRHWRSRTPLSSLRYLLRSPPAGVPEGEFGSSVANGYEVRRWQHLAYVKRDHRLELYRDGVLVASDDCGEGKAIASGLQIVCGRLYPHGSERLFVGQMDELAIYDHALSESEVRKHYAAGGADAAAVDAI